MSGCRSRQDLTFQYPCSLRFPLRAGGTEQARCSVPLAKRGEPKGEGRIINFARAIGLSSQHPAGEQGSKGYLFFVIP